jgi:hypothetical protein
VSLSVTASDQFLSFVSRVQLSGITSKDSAIPYDATSEPLVAVMRVQGNFCAVQSGNNQATLAAVSSCKGHFLIATRSH